MTAEQRIIDRLTAGWTRPRTVRVGPGDDGAVLGDGAVISTDALVEGVHFDGALSADDVGYKAVAVNVSDVAAMGARPTWVVLALSLPLDDAAWVDGLARGVRSGCDQFGVHLVGGDTTRAAGARVVTITCGGALVGRPLRRDGARPGDTLWLTGTPGLAHVGWRRPGAHPDADRALRRPAPPVGFALALARAGWATAAMDTSDGLAADLPRLCRASRVGARVAGGALPRHPAVASIDEALAGGEDYGLLFTARPGRAPGIEGLARACGVVATRIGEVVSGGVVCLAEGGWPAPAFEHFDELEVRPFS